MTLTLQVAFLPLKVLTVMVALPVPTAVTTPFASTVATVFLLLLHFSAPEAVPLVRV